MRTHHDSPLDLGLSLPSPGPRPRGASAASAPVRWAEVQRVRRAIAAGAYDAAGAGVWDVVLARLAHDLAS
jgi:hypothetical protein